MKLNLKRPIIFFDLETTGVDVSCDHIVEISYIKLYPNGNEESKTMRVRPVNQQGQVLHIPETASAIHGITDEDVADCPTFRDIADELAKTYEGCDLAGFNSNKFDIPLLVEEFLRAGVNIDFSDRCFIDVQNIYHKLEKRTLSAAYQFYCGKDLENAHSANADTRATLEVLEAQLDYYPSELQNSVDFLSEFSTINRNIDFAGRIIRDEKGEEILNFGKYKGISFQEVLRREPGYVDWVLQGNFSLNTKQVFQRLALKYRFKK